MVILIIKVIGSIPINYNSMIQPINKKVNKLYYKTINLQYTNKALVVRQLVSLSFIVLSARLQNLFVNIALRGNISIFSIGIVLKKFQILTKCLRHNLYGKNLLIKFVNNFLRLNTNSPITLFIKNPTIGLIRCLLGLKLNTSSYCIYKTLKLKTPVTKKKTNIKRTILKKILLNNSF